MDKKSQIIINLALSIILFVLIFYFVGLDKITNVILAADVPLIVFALISYVILTFVMSYRIKIVLESINEKLSLSDVIPSNLAGMLASDFTPARVGYFFTAFSLSSRFGIKNEKTIISIFGPQLFDFLIKATAASILTAIIISQTGVNGIIFNAVIIALAFSAVIVAGLVVFYPPFLDYFKFLEKLPFVPKIFAFIRDMHQHAQDILKVKWKIVGITFVSWFIKGFEWTLLARAIGINITNDFVLDVGFMMIFQGAITILQFIPMPTLAGAGASEAGFAAILYFFGIPLEQSITFGFLTRLVMIVIDLFSLPVILAYLQKHKLENLLDRIMSLKH